MLRSPPIFDSVFRRELTELLGWRRDVRRFRPDPVDPALLDHLLDLGCLAPSVGNSQPWRFATVDAPERRGAVIAEFEHCNRKALAGYEGERARLYAGLKLEGLQVAPVQLAVFCDEATEQGSGLGQRTMPETRRYSTVAAIHTLWLAARAHGLGLGWLSILRPAEIIAVLEPPAGWELIAYLCLGWPADEDPVPELERRGWQSRQPACRQVLQR